MKTSYSGQLGSRFHDVRFVRYTLIFFRVKRFTFFFRIAFVIIRIRFTCESQYIVISSYITIITFRQINISLLYFLVSNYAEGTHLFVFN